MQTHSAKLSDNRSNDPLAGKHHLKNAEAGKHVAPHPYQTFL